MTMVDERATLETEPEADSYERLLARLSHQSVVKHFDAYADIAWDSDDFRIDAADPRWELNDFDPLGATAWYRSQPADVRSRIGLHLIASKMKMGLEFESVLKRGLLEYASTLPNGSPEFRYVYHEVIEEAQHALMFQEFVNRTGYDIPGIPRVLRPSTRHIVKMGRRFPELFFVFVLGGEDPIDHVQRRSLRERDVHPLLGRIMRIHVTEEARHLSFARHYLKTRIGAMSRRRRRILAYQAPVILAVMARLMMRPHGQVIRTHGIPKSVVRAAYSDNAAHRAETVAALRKVRNLCHELGIVTSGSRLLWRAFGIWEASASVS
jgi:para-aminobenzoate N-oxygenase AurF